MCVYCVFLFILLTLSVYYVFSMECSPRSSLFHRHNSTVKCRSCSLYFTDEESEVNNLTVFVHIASKGKIRDLNLSSLTPELFLVTALHTLAKENLPVCTFEKQTLQHKFYQKPPPGMGSCVQGKPSHP